MNKSGVSATFSCFERTRVSIVWTVHLDCNSARAKETQGDLVCEREHSIEEQTLKKGVCDGGR